MKIRTLRLLLCLTLLFPAWSSADGNIGGSSTATRRLSRGASNEEPIENRFNFKFPGGSAQELIAALSEASGQPVNALIPDEANIFTMPPMDYHNVTTEEVLGMLRWTRSIPLVTNSQSGSSVQYRAIGYYWEENDNIWVMRMDMLPEQPPVQYTVKPLFVGEMLNTYTIEDITTAIDTAWELQGAVSDESQLLFHPETAILLVKGTDQELRVMQSVVDTMMQGQQSLTDLKKQKDYITVTVIGKYGLTGVKNLAQGTDLLELASRTGVSSSADNQSVYFARISRIDKEGKVKTFDVDMNPLRKYHAPPFLLQHGDIINWHKVEAKDQ